MIKRLQQQLSNRLTLWVIGGMVVLQVWAVLNQKHYAKDGLPQPFIYDALGYYSYLPAVFIHGDLGWEWVKEYYDYGFVPLGNSNTLYRSPLTGTLVNKYAIGTAILELPFFLLGHAAAHLLGYEANGFSIPYRLMGMLGAIFYAALAFWVLRGLLRRYFSEWVTAAVIASLGLGTNLLHYTIQEPGMSHVYSFLAMALVTAYTLKWREEGKLSQMLMLAFACGLTLLIRPTNGLILLFPLLYGARSFREQFSYFAQRWPHLLAGIAVGLLVMSPQLLYNKVFGGTWLYYSYGDEGFLFSEPEMWKVLFGFRKGWFIYSPILLGILPGFFLLRRYVPHAALALALYALLNLYVVSSWWSWWYGGSFGMRALIETTAPLSLALAAFFAWMSSPSWRKMLLSALIAFFILLSLIQTYQYKWAYIHWENMNARVYWKVFMRPRIPWEEHEEIKKMLGPDPDYQRRQRSGTNDE